MHLAQHFAYSWVYNKCSFFNIKNKVANFWLYWALWITQKREPCFGLGQFLVVNFKIHFSIFLLFAWVFEYLKGSYASRPGIKYRRGACDLNLSVEFSERYQAHTELLGKAGTPWNNEWIIPKALRHTSTSFKSSLLQGITLKDHNRLDTGTLQRQLQASWSRHSWPKNNKMEIAEKPHWWSDAWNKVILCEQSPVTPMRQKGRATTPRGVWSAAVAGPEDGPPMH